MGVKYFDTLDKARAFNDDTNVLDCIFQCFDNIIHTGIGFDPNGFFIQVVLRWNKSVDITVALADQLGVRLGCGTADERTAMKPHFKSFNRRATFIRPGMALVGKGTFGAFVYKDSKEYLLSCRHVLDDQDHESGIYLKEPYWDDKLIARYDANYYLGPLDCGIARVESDMVSKIKPEILGIGFAPKQVIAPSLGQKVAKYGPATFRQFGYVRLVDVRRERNQRFKYFEVQPFDNGDNSFARNGDSGSLVVIENDRVNAVGMVFEEVTYDLSGVMTRSLQVPKGALCISMEDITRELKISLTN
ncbi:hypothetical protein RT717_11260 [Imperialibacter roseus]|uniref:Serine protease n=1 Tax=Imperialibacter roseus TaxID=1324217 RepID=A0ABZ0IXW9_9BACT|nr:hypothetical protein [Imperialibacter roseus]WOK09215.1 hypothetical protein RT717_11260 [Imperialibacter roseus]